jgi:hypothetical protein
MPVPYHHQTKPVGRLRDQDARTCPSLSPCSVRACAYGWIVQSLLCRGWDVDAFGVLDEVLNDYESFVSGFLNIQDEAVRAKVEQEIADGLLWPEPCARGLHSRG